MLQDTDGLFASGYNVSDSDISDRNGLGGRNRRLSAFHRQEQDKRVRRKLSKEALFATKVVGE